MKSSQHQALLEKQNQLQGDPEGLLTCTAYFMVMKGLIATGILVLAKGFSRAGWLFSTIALILAAYFSYLAAIRLIRARRRFRGTFTQLGQYAYGGWGKWAVNVTLLVSQLCFNIGHIAFTTSHVSIVFNQWFYDSKDVVQLWHIGKFCLHSGIIVFCIISILIQFRNIKTLAIFYIFADTLMLLTVILVISQSSERISSQGGVAQSVTLINPGSSIGFFGVAFFAYESIGIYLPVAAKMRRPAQMEKVLFYAFSSCLIIYILMGLLPYFAFGADGLTLPFVTEVILVNFHGWYNQLTNVLYGVNLVATFTLMAYPAIQVLEGFFLRPYEESYREQEEEKNLGLTSQNRERYCGSLGIIRNIMRVLYTFTVVLIAVLAAGHYERFTSLAGALTCTPIAYILPVAFHYKLTRLTKREKICDLALIIIGVVGMVIVTTLSIVEWASL